LELEWIRLRLMVRFATSGTGLTPYEEWALGDEDFSPGDPDSDADSDGVANLMEFVLDGNPVRGDSHAVLPRMELGVGVMVLRFSRSHASLGQPVSLKIQINGNLGSWDPAMDVPIGAKRKFVRLAASLP
jgi:hypothetical protein